MLSGVASGVVFSSAILGLLGLDRDGHGGVDPALVRNRQRARGRACGRACPRCSPARPWRAACAGRTSRAAWLRSGRAGRRRRGLGARARSSGEAVLAHDELGLERELVAGEAHGLAGERLVHAGELEHHAPGLDDGDPALGVALAGAHAGLGGLLREGLVGIDVDPDLAAALDLARHRDSGRLDLAVREPAGLEGLQPVLAERDALLAAREPGPAAPVLLAELDSLGGQHQREIPPLRSGRPPPRPPWPPRPPPPRPPPPPPKPPPRPPPPGPPCPPRPRGPPPRPPPRPPPPRPSPRPPPRPPRSRPSRPPRPRSSRSPGPWAGSSSEVRSAPV